MSSVAELTVRSGLGAIPHATGVVFRVWAPFADAVSVLGTFNDWNPSTDPCQKDEHGNWYLLIFTMLMTLTK